MTMRPTSDYRLSHTASGYGSYYDRQMHRGYYGAMLRDHEAPVLAAWVTDLAPARALDFACGTGRITGLLVDLVPDVVGVDVSLDMLGRARDAVPGATFVAADLTDRSSPAGRPEDGPFDLVTAFRFFQNAGPELRAEALDALAARLRPGGTLVLNVQSQAESPAGRAYRLRARLRKRPIHQLSHGEVVDLLDRHGFTVEETYWYGHVPRPGDVAGGLLARLDRPARAVAETLHVPSRRLAQMFLVRASLRDRP